MLLTLIFVPLFFRNIGAREKQNGFFTNILMKSQMILDAIKRAVMFQHRHLLLTLYYFLVFLTGSVSITDAVCQAANRLHDIRYWSSPASTRIVLDFKGEARYNSFSLQNPDRLVVDLKGFDGYVPKKIIKIEDGIVKKVRVSKKSRSVIRIVVDLEKKSSHKIFPLKKLSKKHPRLVLDVIRSDLEKAVRVKRAKTRKLKKTGDYIVVVDPGHGGEDPGAVSKRGGREKDIVLSFAKKVVKRINRKKGVKAYLTRKGDYFIPLKKRMDIAKQYGADLFVSIHSDSSFSTRVYGSSVYCLSLKGASSNKAKLAAIKENASDYIGGVPLDHKNNDLNAIIIDLVQTHNLNSSLRLAGLTLKEISKINRLHTKRPQQAEFAVLRSPDIPSILIETDFISNPRREKRMKSQWFQDAFSRSITNAVCDFLSVDKLQPAKPGKKYHLVKKGETLSSIARKYKTTIKRLRKLNGLSARSTIRYGKKLRVL